MIANINSFLAYTSNWINALSLLIATMTLITMMRFKKRIRIEFEKKSFTSHKNRLLKELDGIQGSLVDGLYSKAFLENIDLILNEVLTSYTFLPFMLTLRIRYVCFCINHKYIIESVSGTDISRHKLCRQLRHISVLLRKE